MKIGESAAHMRVLVLALAVGGAHPSAAGNPASGWPEFSRPSGESRGGEKDAGVVIGAQTYAALEGVPGARQNAEDWRTYLVEALKVPPGRVVLLRDGEAVLERMREGARRAASGVRPGGTLWFVFIGNGAPSRAGQDGLLVGADAEDRADRLEARSLGRGELLEILSRGPQVRTVVLLDASFGGKSASGRELAKGLGPPRAAPHRVSRADQRAIVLTAAKPDQFAGLMSVAGEMRPAFSYLALGALRGWAANGRGEVTAGELAYFAGTALRLAKGRRQTPGLEAGNPSTVLARGHEPAPELGALDRDDGASAFAPAPAEALTAPTAAGAGPKPVIEWVHIAGGAFAMGHAERSSSAPIRTVTVKPFFMAKTEVTNKQYRACVAAGACAAPPDSCLSAEFREDDQPVVCVNWHQASAFSRWVGGSLPSEAQWEYAARSAGKGRDYPWGDEAATCARAVIAEAGEGCGRGATWPVCSKPLGNSEQGLCDLIGNAWEWVQDWHHDSYVGAPPDAEAWESPAGAARVRRGGSWYYGGIAPAPRAFDRSRLGPMERDDNLGFRPVRDAD